MRKEELFRTCVFGGYNKDDVLGYVHQLENELERLKSREADTGKRKKARVENEGNIEGDMIVFNEQAVEEPLPENERMKTERPARETMLQESETSDAMRRLKGQLERTKAELEQVRKLLQEKESLIERSSRELEEKEWQIRKNNRLLEEKEFEAAENSRQLNDVKRECEKLQKEHEAYEDDYRAIKNVLLNARVDAGVIVAKAQEKAKLIMEEAQRNVQIETRKSAALLVDHLKENQEGLDVSKVYLEQQLKSIDNVKQQIEGIRSNIENMYFEKEKEKEKETQREEDAHQSMGEENVRRESGQDVTIDVDLEEEFIMDGEVPKEDGGASEKGTV